jgi:hypothetical protein
MKFTVMTRKTSGAFSARVLWKSVGVALGAAVLLSGCASCTSTLNGQRAANWEMFDTSGKSLAPVGDQSRVVVYRLAGANDVAEDQFKPVNVFVNEAYLASLLPDASTQTLLCPGAHRLSAVSNRQAAALRYRSASATQYVGSQYAAVQLAASDVQYFRVHVEQGAAIRVEQRPVAQALDEIAQLPRQAHTIPRTALLECGSAQSASASR